MHNGESLRSALDQGKSVLGTWSLLSDPAAVEILAVAGFDFVIIDMEHGPHGFATASNLIRAAEARGISHYCDLLEWTNQQSYEHWTVERTDS